MTTRNEDAEQIEVIAKAIKACTDTFESPVRYYIEPEARKRWNEQNPDKDALSDGPDIDWEMESYRIIARAVLAAAQATRSAR